MKTSTTIATLTSTRCNVCCTSSCFFFSSRRRHTRFDCDWSSDVCSSDLVVGSVEDRDLLEQAFQDPSILDRPVGAAMGPPLPTVGVGEPIELAVRRTEQTGAVVVLDAGHPIGILTRSDLLGFLVGRPVGRPAQ